MAQMARCKMKTKMARTILIAGALILCAGVSFSQSREEQRTTLRGLKGIVVVVEDLEPGIGGEGGLTPAQIRTDAELRIRKASIRILSAQEGFKVAGFPRLYINAQVRKLTPRQFPCAIKVQVLQEMKLVRNPAMQCSASSWEVAALGVANDMRTIREDLGDLIDMFINDYLSVNPAEK